MPTNKLTISISKIEDREAIEDLRKRLEFLNNKRYSLAETVMIAVKATSKDAFLD